MCWQTCCALRTAVIFADNCGRIGTLNVPTTAQQLAETCSRMLHTHCKFVEADHPVEKAGRSERRRRQLFAAGH